MYSNNICHTKNDLLQVLDSASEWARSNFPRAYEMYCEFTGQGQIREQLETTENKTVPAIIIAPEESTPHDSTTAPPPELYKLCLELGKELSETYKPVTQGLWSEAS